MTDPGVPHDDMLSFPWRSRMDIPQMGDEALDALLAQDRGPGETAATLRPVADVLAALRAAPSHGELTGLDPVLTEFRGVGGMPDGFHRSRPRRPALLRTLLSVKVAGAVAAAVLGGSVAAAYAGVLPAALQKIAHNSIAAPAASARPSPRLTHRAGTPVGPDPAGPAAHGLCTAYSHAEAQGSAARQAGRSGSWPPQPAAPARWRRTARAHPALGPAHTASRPATPPAGPPPGLAIHRPASTRARRHHDDEPAF